MHACRCVRLFAIPLDHLGGIDAQHTKRIVQNIVNAADFLGRVYDQISYRTGGIELVDVDGGMDDLVLEVGDTGPFVASLQPVGVLAAVTIADLDQHVATVIAGFQFDLRDTGEILTQDIGVLGDWRAKRVEVDLLIESEVLLGPFARSGVVDRLLCGL